MIYNNVSIAWMGHDSFKISATNGKVSYVYIDPFKVNGSPNNGDIVISTHPHHDHFSPEDIKKVIGKNGVLVVTKDNMDKAHSVIKGVVGLKPGESHTVENIKVEAVAAYNTNKAFHPKTNEWVGVIIEVNGVRVYHAGDTDYIPEMKKLGKIDIALLPVSGTYVMTAEEAFKAAKDIRPKIAVPMHYGTIVGNIDNAKQFEELCSKAGIKTQIPEKGK